MLHRFDEDGNAELKGIRETRAVSENYRMDDERRVVRLRREDADQFLHGSSAAVASLFGLAPDNGILYFSNGLKSDLLVG